MQVYIDRLTSLSERGILSDVTVAEWPGRASVDPEEGCEAGRRFSKIESIARDLDVDLAPSFERISRYNAFADATEEMVVFPTIGLVVTDPTSGPVALAPCALGDGPCHVDDVIRQLEAVDNPEYVTKLVP